MGILKKIVLIFLSAASIAGCTTTVPINVRHAPAMNLGAVKTIKVEKFSVTGGGQSRSEWPHHKNVGDALVDAAVGSAVSFISGGRINPDSGDRRYTPDNSERAQFQDAHFHGLIAAIMQNGYFQVVESDAADATISGSVVCGFNDEVKESESKNSDGKKEETYTLTRNVLATVYFTVTARGGNVLASSMVSAKMDRSWNGKSEDEARRQAIDATKLIADAIADTHGNVVKNIAPYYVREERRLMGGKADEIGKGNEAAGKGNWDEAVKNWNAGLSSGKEVDRVAATHNLAVFDEVMDKLDDALKKYEEVYALTKAAEDATNIARMKARIDEKAALRQMDTARSAGAPSP